MLQVEQFSLPRIEDLFAKLYGCSKFSKINISQSYSQVRLAKKFKALVTISTYKGLFRNEQLPFGVVSAPTIFQKLMKSVFDGMEGVILFLDDILISGANL